MSCPAPAAPAIPAGREVKLSRAWSLRQRLLSARSCCWRRLWAAAHSAQKPAAARALQCDGETVKTKLLQEHFWCERGRRKRETEWGGVDVDLPGFYTLQQRQPIWVVERFSFIAAPRPLLAENVQTCVLKSDSSAGHWADQPYENVQISMCKSWGGGGAERGMCHLCSPGILEGFLLHTCSRTDYLRGTAHLYLSG